MGADVAALYIDPRGPYPKMPGVECYDEARNAEMYAGPHPVVAHPPCGPWGRLKHLHGAGGAELAPHAVWLVREFGGVLEHPAHSKLWGAMGLPKPGEPADAHGGRTFEVNQVDWGHVARKKTWLYCVRCEPGPTPPKREPTHWVSGFMREGSRGKPPPGIKICSAQQRRRTPPAFAAWLVELARSTRGR